MIASITGTIQYQGNNFVILQAGKIGYKVFIPDLVARDLSGEVTVFTHEVIRDDGHELYGFMNTDALELFWKLISISGVGPKVGQKILATGQAEDVRRKIMEGDLSFLTSISGVGKKTAQKIILELKGVLAEEGTYASVDSDAVEGLVGLGYSRREAEEALSKIGDQNEDTASRVREALKLLGRR